MNKECITKDCPVRSKCARAKKPVNHVWHQFKFNYEANEKNGNPCFKPIKNEK